jgi:LysM repeat protein
MIVQNDSKWIIYALVGAVLLGILINDKVNSVATTMTQPNIRVAPLQIYSESVPTPVPDQPTLKPSVPIASTSVPVTTISVVPTLSPQVVIYTVHAGDTLYSLARRYNVTIEAIMAKNRLANYTIYVGQQLIIPR